MGVSKVRQEMFKIDVKYQCPKCKGAIDRGKKLWHCQDCEKQYEVRRGVPILSENENSGLGFIWADDPNRFLDEVEKLGWKEALVRIQKPNAPNKLREALAPNRIMWQYLFEMDSSWKILDIGAGTGGVACQLAKNYSVVAVDSSWCDVAFMHLRAQQDNLHQFETVVADALSIPIESNQFDLITMIGSFEWMPTSLPQNPPRQTQLQALLEAHRLLKPGGNLFLGIENRYYLGYYVGVPEQHTNIKYISLMNRDDSNILSQDLRNGSPYLEQTHSKDEYLELFKEAGFVDIQTFWLYPDYRLPNYIIPLDQSNIVKSFIEGFLDPRDFSGIESDLYQFYRYLDPNVISNHVRDFGFLAFRSK